MSNDSLAVVTFDFHGDTLDVVPGDGVAHVSIKRMCEAIGISYAAQLVKLKADDSAVVAMIATTGSDGKTYEIACLDVRSIPLWLATIHPSKVKAEVREKLIRYRRECADVLADHFLGKRAKDDDSLALRDEMEAIAEANRDHILRLQVRLELLDPTSSGLIERQRADEIRGLLRAASRIAIKASPMPRTIQAEVKERDNLLRVHVGYPQGLGQRWENLPLAKLGDAMSKARAFVATEQKRLKSLPSTTHQMLLPAASRA